MHLLLPMFMLISTLSLSLSLSHTHTHTYTHTHTHTSILPQTQMTLSFKTVIHLSLQPPHPNKSVQGALKFGGMLAFLKAAFRNMIINRLSRFQVVEEDCWNNGFSKVGILHSAVFCRTSDCRQSVFLSPAASSAAETVCDSLRCCSFSSPVAFCKLLHLLQLHFSHQAG